MTRLSIAKLLIVKLSLLSMVALALPSDRDLPIQGNADDTQVNTATGVVTLNGNAHVWQGNLQIYAETMIIETEQQTSQLTYLSAKGNPARYIDLPNADQDKIEVTGSHIEYFPEQNLIVTTGNARINQGGNQASGERIEYNADTGVMSIQSKRSVSGNEADDQAELIIQPGRVD